MNTVFVYYLGIMYCISLLLLTFLGLRDYHFSKRPSSFWIPLIWIGIVIVSGFFW